MESVKEARMIYWYKLRDYGVEIKRYTFAKAEKSKVPKEVLPDVSGIGGPAPTGKDAKAKAPAKDAKNKGV